MPFAQTRTYLAHSFMPTHLVASRTCLPYSTYSLTRDVNDKDEDEDDVGGGGDDDGAAAAASFIVVRSGWTFGYWNEVHSFTINLFDAQSSPSDSNPAFSRMPSPVVVFDISTYVLHGG